MDRELIEYLDRRFEELRGEFRSAIAASVAETRRHFESVIPASAAETRRHFDVVAEGLMHRIRLVGEGVIAVDQKVDRLATETRAGFQKVDRRVLRLHARIIDSREP